MKIGFLFISILTVAGSAWWALYRHQEILTWQQKWRIASRSLLAGIAVYFILLLLALAYMAAFTT